MATQGFTGFETQVSEALRVEAWNLPMVEAQDALPLILVFDVSGLASPHGRRHEIKPDSIDVLLSGLEPERSGSAGILKLALGSGPIPRTCPPYPPCFRWQMVEPVRAGRNRRISPRSSMSRRDDPEMRRLRLGTGNHLFTATGVPMSEPHQAEAPRMARMLPPVISSAPMMRRRSILSFRPKRAIRTPNRTLVSRKVEAMPTGSRRRESRARL